MKVQVVVTAAGEVKIATQDGSFLEGKARIEALLAFLGQAGLPLVDLGEVETHRHEHGEVHVHGHVNNG